MSVNIVFSKTSDYESVDQAVQQTDLIHNLSSSGIKAFRFFITNTGTTTAKNCGFYITPKGQDLSNGQLSGFNTILSWASSNTHGVFTIQGTDELTAYNAAPSTYNDSSRLHSFRNGTTISNILSLQDSDGDGNDLEPKSTGGSTIEAVLLIRIPASVSAGKYEFELNFYYEEEI